MPVMPVSVRVAKEWLDNQEAVLVDVREPAEHSAEHIPGAVLLPLGAVNAAALPDCTGKKLVVHCRKGGRGASACDALLRQNPDLAIYNLEGGIEQWVAEGLPVERSGKRLLPLDRQVQLTVGVLIVVASVLAHLASPIFLLLTGFIGAGLTVAGLTGFCGLALVLAKMPWNQAA